LLKTCFHFVVISVMATEGHVACGDHNVE